MSLPVMIVLGVVAWFAAGLLVAGWFWLGGIGTPDDHEIENQRWDRRNARTCLFGSCNEPAKWIGVSPSTLAHDETYPTYACDEHVIGLVRVRDLDGNYRAGEARVLADLDPGDQP